MSACVSSHGEYSEHATNEDLWCSRCYQYDTAAVDAAVIELNMLRARDEALRALIEKWESTARVLSARYDDTGERELRGRSKALRIAADELERAIGGGR